MGGYIWDYIRKIHSKWDTRNFHYSSVEFRVYGNVFRDEGGGFLDYSPP